MGRLLSILACAGVTGGVWYTLNEFEALRDPQAIVDAQDKASGLLEGESEEKVDYGDPYSWLQPNGYPVTRKLKSQDGRSAEFEVLGRTETTVYTRRQDTGAEYTIALDSLSAADAKYLRSLPAVTVSSMSSLKNKQDEAQRIIVKIKQLRESLSYGSVSATQRRGTLSEIERLERRLFELKAQIQRS